MSIQPPSSIPQMSPMNWVVLFTYFSSMFIIVVVKLHFTKHV